MEKLPFEVRLKATTSLFGAFLVIWCHQFCKCLPIENCNTKQTWFVCKHSVSLLPAHHRIREDIECAYLIHIIGMNGHLAKAAATPLAAKRRERNKSLEWIL